MSDSKKQNGNEVEAELQLQLANFISKDLMPVIIHIDSYSYYLLKDMLQRTGRKTTSGYKELMMFEVDGYDLVVLIDRQSEIEGTTYNKPEIIKIYGE